MIRKILLAGASALALSATAAQASDGCNVSFTTAGSYTCDVAVSGLYDFSVLGAGGGAGGFGGYYGGGGGGGGGGSSFSSLLLSAVAGAAGGAGQDGFALDNTPGVYSDVGLVSGRIHLAVGDLITFFIGGGGGYGYSYPDGGAGGAGAQGAEGGNGGPGGYRVGGVGGLGGGSSYLNGLVTNGVTSTTAVPYYRPHNVYAPPGPDGRISLSLFSADGPGGVPEPATWMMMLTGFGFMGYVLRRRILRRA